MNVVTEQCEVSGEVGRWGGGGGGEGGGKTTEREDRVSGVMQGARGSDRGKVPFSCVTD